jgi:hypothetical protein
MALALESRSISLHLFRLRVILAALFAGIVAGLVSVALVVQPPANPINLIVFEPVLIASVLVAVVIAWRVLPPLLDRAMRRQILQAESHSTAPNDAVLRRRVTQLLNGHLTRTIVTAAIVEAPAMLGIVGYILGATQAGVTMAAVCAALIAMMFPTRGRLEYWLQSQFRLLDEAAMIDPLSTAG